MELKLYEAAYYINEWGTVLFTICYQYIGKLLRFRVLNVKSL